MSLTFFVLTVLLVCTGFAVVLLRNPIHGALNLVLHLLGIAGMYALLDAHFLAAVQIIVYAGAVVVLVLFVLMLLNVKVEAPSRRETLLSIGAVAGALAFLAVTVPMVLAAFGGLGERDPFAPAAPVSAVPGTVAAIGRVLYGKYVFTFEAASVLIMAAVAGAVMLAKRRYGAGSNGRHASSGSAT